MIAEIDEFVLHFTLWGHGGTMIIVPGDIQLDSEDEYDEAFFILIHALEMESNPPT
jgi:hypothetical protein